jgi:hypothetical protein
MWEKVNKNQVKETDSGVVVDIRELKKDLKHFEEQRDSLEDTKELDDETIAKAVRIHTDREARKMFVSAIVDKQQEISKFEKMLGT